MRTTGHHESVHTCTGKRGELILDYTANQLYICMEAPSLWAKFYPAATLPPEAPPKGHLLGAFTQLFLAVACTLVGMYFGGAIFLGACTAQGSYKHYLLESTIKCEVQK